MAVKLHIYMFGAKFQIQILYFLSAKMSLFFTLFYTLCSFHYTEQFVIVSEEVLTF